MVAQLRWGLRDSVSDTSASRPPRGAVRSPPEPGSGTRSHGSFPHLAPFSV